MRSVGESGRAGSTLPPRCLRAVGLALAVVLFLWSWVFLGHWAYARHERSVAQNNDLTVYQDYGLLMRDGLLPYRDFAVVYPPGALPVFFAPTYATSSHERADYARWFGRLMAACGLACLVFVALARPPTRAVVFFAFSPLLVGSLLVSRFDLWPAALVAGSVAAFVRDRHTVGWAALGAAFAAKLFGVVLIPLAVVWTLRRRGSRAVGLGLGAWALVVAATFVPFAILAPHGLYQSLHDQASRAIQIESLLGALLMTFGHPVEILSLGAVSVAGHGVLAAISTAIELTVLIALWIGFARGEAEPARLIRYAAACVCCFVALGKVLSPQYLIWLVPLVPLVAGVRGVVATALFGTALILTQFSFPGTYTPSFVLIRDLVLVAVLAVLSLPAGRLAAALPRLRTETQKNAHSR